MMARAAGSQAVTYGYATSGIADSALLAARREIAGAAAPTTAGKNPNLVLLTLDAAGGTMDPAFEANAACIHAWASAWWDKWVPDQQLTAAFDAASRSTKTTWNSVTGPVAALLASLRRIGWSMTSATTLVDDLGEELHVNKDSPEAFRRAANRSTRRWRLAKARRDLPGLIPDGVTEPRSRCSRTPPEHSSGRADGFPDATGGCNARASVIVDFSYIAKALVRGSSRAAKHVKLWTSECAPYLVSAITGGQWSQARKSLVKSWNTSSLCQLCEVNTGTIDHRFSCAVSMPEDGWPQAPASAKLALDSLEPRQLQLLRTRGMLAIKVRAVAIPAEGSFTWVKQPREDLLDGNERWYFDGSAMNATWRELCTTGYGIVVTARDGSLIGFGRGTPPNWIKTAPAAEAWALSQVLSMVPCPPAMTTDCNSLISTAAKGTSRATSAKAALARIWTRIASSLDGDTTRLVSSSILRWTLAHLSQASIGSCANGTDRVITAIDWRANRMADALAKEAAAEFAADAATIRLVKSAEEAARFHMALLGVVTHKANHCPVQKEVNGEWSWISKRDSLERPKAASAALRRECKPRPSKKQEHCEIPVDCERPHRIPASWLAPSRATDKAAARRKQKTERARTEQEATQAAVAGIAERLRPAASSASERLAALRERIRNRAATE